MLCLCIFLMKFKSLAPTWVHDFHQRWEGHRNDIKASCLVKKEKKYSVLTRITSGQNATQWARHYFIRRWQFSWIVGTSPSEMAFSRQRTKTPLGSKHWKLWQINYYYYYWWYYVYSTFYVKFYTSNGFHLCYRLSWVLISIYEHNMYGIYSPCIHIVNGIKWLKHHLHVHIYEHINVLPILSSSVGICEFVDRCKGCKSILSKCVILEGCPLVQTRTTNAITVLDCAAV